MSANTDIRFLFVTRIVRMFAYGLLAVILALYLAQAGLSDAEIGLLLTLTLLGDTVMSLWITTHADRSGRKRMLLVGAGLMVFAGILFAVTRNFYLLLLAATIGVRIMGQDVNILTQIGFVVLIVILLAVFRRSLEVEDPYGA